MLAHQNPHLVRGPPRGRALARRLLTPDAMNLFRSLAAALLLAVSLPACDGGESTAEEQDVTEITGRFEQFIGEDDQTYFHLLAANGELILRSEGYTSATAAKGGITSVKKNGTSDARYKLLQADNGEYYFNLTATNGQVVGTSETYGAKADAQKAIAAVKRALTKPTSAEAPRGEVKFETLKGADGKTYFHLRAGNGEIVIQSQGYSSKSAAEKGISAVKNAAVHADSFPVFEGANGQHTFHLVASNGEVLGRGEMYVSKSNALRAAARTRELVRELTRAGAPTDAELEAEVNRAADGLTYTSESDYPFTFVRAEAPDGEITEAMVREQFADLVDADDDADKPMAELFAMESTWEEWKADEVNCWDTEDPIGLEQCTKTRTLEGVLDANLTDVKVFYFGGDGEPGMVDGIGVSVFVVGRTAEGNLAGVKTLAIWT
jgi:uncharacterized protein YegP (UPF0339 family)